MRPLDRLAHQIHQVGATRQIPGIRQTREKSDRRSGVIRFFVMEGPHPTSSGLNRFANSPNDPVVGSTAAQIAAHPFADLFLIEIYVPRGQIFSLNARNPALPFSRHADSGADLPRGAIATLKPVLLDEGLLKRMQGLLRTQSFDGHDRAALILNRQPQTGVDALTVHQHGTGTACALIAALLRARQAQVIAQQIEQGGSDVHLDLESSTVDSKVHDSPSTPDDAAGSNASARERTPARGRRKSNV